jgi:protein-S-isoprenylcysteine O-methyltransferase Ste14
VLDRLDQEDRPGDSRIFSARVTAAGFQIETEAYPDGVKVVVAVAWIGFWVYWLASARAAKHGTRSTGALPLRGLLIVVATLLFVVVHADGLEVHGVVPRVLGTVILLCGLGFAIWARVHLGRNWGMPMTRKDDPELVTSGPYRLVRHPIYTGLLTAVVGTALATNLIVLGIAAVLGIFFCYSATVEERNLGTTFPSAYPAYRERTKMLIPFVL